MSVNTKRICTIALLVPLVLIYACSGGDDGTVAYRRPPSRNESNLNMRGEPLKPSHPDDITLIQTELKYLGYDPGPANGCCSPKTKRAIKQFQIEHGIQSNGAVGPLTERSLLKAIEARAALQKNTPANIRSPSASNP